MIEFRAECGHTVRAKDHDAGETVRCTYCGQDAVVPAPEERDLDHLLTGGEASGDAGPIEARARGAEIFPIADVRKWVGRNARWFRAGLSVAYLAIVLAVVGYGGNWVLELLDASTTSTDNATIDPARYAQQPVSPSTGAGGNQPQPLQPGNSRSGPRQLTGPAFAGLSQTESGLTIESVPTGARIYVSAAERIGGTETPADEENNYKGETPLKLALPATEYVVSLTLPVISKNLRNYPEYRALRQALEQRQDPNDARTYFLSDEAERITLSRSGRGPLMIARHYRVEVSARRGAWTAVTGLFLPDGLPDELVAFCPEANRYTFDAEYVRYELDLYKVPQSLHETSMTLLERIGKLVVRMENSREYQVFQLQPDGNMWNEKFTDQANALAATTNKIDESSAAEEATREILSLPSLHDALERVREVLARGVKIEPVVWGAFLPGGERPQAFNRATDGERVDWIVLIDAKVPDSVVIALGETLVNDQPQQSYTVRRAIIAALERIGEPAARDYLYARSRQVTGEKKNAENVEEIADELIALKRARDKLKVSPTEPGAEDDGAE
jgi:hypothetical protein